MRARFSAFTTIRSKSTKTGSVKSRSSNDSGVENSKILPCCHSRLKPLARNSASRAFSVSVCGESPPLATGLALAAGLRRRPRRFAGFPPLRPPRSGVALTTGNSAFSRVPSPSARTASAASSTESRFTSPSQCTQCTVPQRAYSSRR